MSSPFYKNIEDELIDLGFQITDSNLEKPWGAYFCIDENQTQVFSDKFFDGMDVDSLKIKNKLSTKILIVKPNVRLSWQYHNRCAEIWQVYKGHVGVVQRVIQVLSCRIHLPIRRWRKWNYGIMQKHTETKCICYQSI